MSNSPSKVDDILIIINCNGIEKQKTTISAKLTARQLLEVYLSICLFNCKFTKAAHVFEKYLKWRDKSPPPRKGKLYKYLLIYTRESA